VTGAGLRRIRKRLGLTQGEMAKRIGVSRETYNRWENRQRPLRGPIAALAALMLKAEK
jgi:transcriptional regulator with XRE-family HTH domain